MERYECKPVGQSWQKNAVKARNWENHFFCPILDDKMASSDITAAAAAAADDDDDDNDNRSLI